MVNGDTLFILLTGTLPYRMFKGFIPSSIIQVISIMHSPFNLLREISLCIRVNGSSLYTSLNGPSLYSRLNGPRVYTSLNGPRVYTSLNGPSLYTRPVGPLLYSTRFPTSSTLFNKGSGASLYSSRGVRVMGVGVGLQTVPWLPARGGLPICLKLKQIWRSSRPALQA